MIKKWTPEKARQSALRLLALRDHSERELRRKLADKGCDDHLIEQLLDDFQRLGYIDDDAYAERQIRFLARDKLYGDRRIMRQLLGKGISREQIRQRMDALRVEFPEEEALTMIIRKKIKHPAFINDDPGKRRLVQNLMGRGFSPETLFEILERMLEEQKA